MRGFSFGAAALCTLMTVCAPGAYAQSYPVKPVRIIVPLSAASTGDALARMVGESLAQKLGQPFIVDTRPGASGQIGVNAVVRSAPDAYNTRVVAGDVQRTVNRNE